MPASLDINMSSFEQKFEQAVKDGVFSGAILMAKDKSGIQHLLPSLSHHIYWHILM